jgi:hypothetical protein
VLEARDAEERITRSHRAGTEGDAADSDIGHAAVVRDVIEYLGKTKRVHGPH